MGSPGENWKFIPSLSKLAPVTLHTNETATLNIEMDEKYKKSIRDPDTIVRIEYSIHPDIAKRFGLWEGTVILKETAGKLLQLDIKKANKKSDN